MSLLEMLIEQPESTNLNFKLIWHKNDARLIHDLLCLANARLDKPGPRYIVIGLSNATTKEVVGVQDDKKRKNTAQLNDLLSASARKIPWV